MNEAHTLVLDEDCERTEVDECLSRSIQPRSRREAHWSALQFLRREWSATLFVLLTTLALLVLGYIAHEQRQLSKELRDALRRLEQQHRAVALPPTRIPLAGTSERDADTSPVTKPLPSTRRELESEAAALVAANDYQRALARYRRLAASFPGDSTYQQLVRALESKLVCSKGEGTGERPCD